jgi:hypothetical protein
MRRFDGQLGGQSGVWEKEGGPACAAPGAQVSGARPGRSREEERRKGRREKKEGEGKKKRRKKEKGEKEKKRKEKWEKRGKEIEKSFRRLEKFVRKNRGRVL